MGCGDDVLSIATFGISDAINGDFNPLESNLLSTATGGLSNIYKGAQQDNLADAFDVMLDPSRQYDRLVKDSSEWLGGDVQKILGDYVLPIAGTVFGGPLGSMAGSYMGNKVANGHNADNEQGFYKALVSGAAAAAGQAVAPIGKTMSTTLADAGMSSAIAGAAGQMMSTAGANAGIQYLATGSVNPYSLAASSALAGYGGYKGGSYDTSTYEGLAGGDIQNSGDANFKLSPTNGLGDSTAGLAGYNTGNTYNLNPDSLSLAGNTSGLNVDATYSPEFSADYNTGLMSGNYAAPSLETSQLNTNGDQANPYLKKTGETLAKSLPGALSVFLGADLPNWTQYTPLVAPNFTGLKLTPAKDPESAQGVNSEVLPWLRQDAPLKSYYQGFLSSQDEQTTKKEETAAPGNINIKLSSTDETKKKKVADKNSLGWQAYA